MESTLEFTEKKEIERGKGKYPYGSRVHGKKGNWEQVKESGNK